MRTAALSLFVALVLLLLWRAAHSLLPLADDPPQAPEAGPVNGPRRGTSGLSPDRDGPSLRGTNAAAGSGPVEIRVHTSRGTPLGDVWVEAFEGERVLTGSPADAEGRVRLEDMPYDGSVRVRVRHTRRTKHALPARPGDDGYPRIRGPRLDYPALGEVELRLLLVDAWSGAPLPGSVEIRPTDASVTSEHRREGADLRWTLLIPPGQVESFPLALDLPPGYVRWLELGPALRPGAETRTLTCVYPLRREATVYLDGVLDAEGEPCGDDTYCCVRFRDRHWRYAESELHGRDGRRLWGLPFFRGQEVRVHLENESNTLRWIADSRLPDVPWLPLHIAMPPPETDFRDASSAPPPPPHHEIDRAPRTAALHAKVRHHDGRPAPHVLVTAAQGLDEIEGRTDASGEARLRVPAGDLQLRVTGAAFLPVRREVTLAVGETRQLALDEPPGGRLTVEVVDGRGRSLPFAHVALSVPWVDLQDGDQRVDHWTDIDGARIWPRVAAGEVGYVLRWAGHEVEGVVAVENGGNHRARVVLDEE